MDMMTFFEGLTVWHWLILAVILLTIEFTVGTFDLLFVSIAAFLTAGYKALNLPGVLGEWPGQFVFFAVVSLVLVVIGRTFFAGAKKPSASHPNLNKRASSLVGSTGVATGSFTSGRGQIRIGDTVWSAQLVTDVEVGEGTNVTVEAVEGTLLKVRV